MGNVLYYDDEETISYYLRHLRACELFDAARGAAGDLAGRRSYFWTICLHLRYPDGGRDGVIFHGMAGHPDPEDNGLVMLVVPDLYRHKRVLDEMVRRLRSSAFKTHFDLEKPSAPDVETDRIEWPHP